MVVPPPAGGFDMGKVMDPQQKPGTFTAAEYMAISENLAKAGLSCDANTPGKIPGYVSTILSQLENVATAGDVSFIASADNPSKPALPTHFVVDPTNPWVSKMDVILANLDKIEKDQFETNTDRGTFSSSIVDDVTEAFTNVGKVIGKVKNGNIDPGQIANEIGFFMQEMEVRESEENFAVEDSKAWFIMVPPPPGQKLYPAIGGVTFSFSVSIKNYKDKKSSTHEASYEVTQKNIIFTDAGTFLELYKKVSGI